MAKKIVIKVLAKAKIDPLKWPGALIEQVHDNGDTESRLMFLGYSPLGYKLFVWTFSAILCGIAGAIDLAGRGGPAGGGAPNCACMAAGATSSSAAAAPNRGRAPLLKNLRIIRSTS